MTSCCEICLLRLGGHNLSQTRTNVNCDNNARNKHNAKTPPTRHRHDNLNNIASDNRAKQKLASSSSSHSHYSELNRPHPKHHQSHQVGRAQGCLFLRSICSIASLLLLISLLHSPAGADSISSIIESVHSIDNRNDIYSTPETHVIRQSTRHSSVVNGLQQTISNASLANKQHDGELRRRASVSRDDIGTTTNNNQHNKSSEINHISQRGKLATTGAQTTHETGASGLRHERANQIKQTHMASGRAKRSSQSPLVERARHHQQLLPTGAPVCSDCLAIPLVAIVGSKQLNGFILQPSSNLHRHYPASQEQISTSNNQFQAANRVYATPRQQQNQQQQQQAADDGPLYTTSVGLRERWASPGEQPRPSGEMHHTRQAYQNDYGYEEHEPPTLPFEPKSDEKCPMTGPLTVCDQIGSYPADVILTKVQGAKKLFGQTYFNLDSLFSDESQHSSEPFESMPMDMARIKPDTVGGNANSTASSRKFHHDSAGRSRHFNANIDTSYHYDNQQATSGSSGGGAKSTTRDYQRAHRSADNLANEGGGVNKKLKGFQLDRTQIEADARGPQIVEPTGAVEKPSPLRRGSSQRSYHRRGLTTANSAAVSHDGDDSSQIMSHITSAGAPGDTRAFEPARNDGQKRAPNDLRAAPRMASAGGINGRPVADGAPASSAQGVAAAASAAVEAEEFLYLVERRGFHIASERQSGAEARADKDGKMASNLRRPYQTGLTSELDCDDANRYTRESGDAAQTDQTANHNGGSAPSRSPFDMTPNSGAGHHESDGHFETAASEEVAAGARRQHIASSVTTNSAHKLAPTAAPRGGGSGGDGKSSARRFGHSEVPISPEGLELDENRRTSSRVASVRAKQAEIDKSSSEPAARRAKVSASAAPGLVLPANLGSGAQLAPTSRRPSQITATAGQQLDSGPTLLSNDDDGDDDDGARSGRRIKSLERLRRQVPPILVDNIRSSEMSGGSAATSVDPERASSAASTGQPQPVCRARSIYISPRAALNDKKQWKYVVNAPERDPRIKQIIRVDICENPFEPCSDQVTLPLGFTSQCKQKYAKKKLLALDSRSGLLEVDTFFIPSCCVCQLIPAARDDLDGPPMTPVEEAPPQPPSSNETADERPQTTPGDDSSPALARASSENDSAEESRAELVGLPDN